MKPYAVLLQKFLESNDTNIWNRTIVRVAVGLADKEFHRRMLKTSKKTDGDCAKGGDIIYDDISARLSTMLSEWSTRRNSGGSLTRCPLWLERLVDMVAGLTVASDIETAVVPFIVEEGPGLSIQLTPPRRMRPLIRGVTQTDEEMDCDRSCGEGSDLAGTSVGVI